MGALTLTANKTYQTDFAPLVPLVEYANFNDLKSAEKLIDDETCGVFVEPVQGEGGVTPTTKEFMQVCMYDSF